ncbi:ATPase family gene 2 protein homolog B [Musca autumnalis]|uniref:ATPase family gene 2 protein homolog B n=1 Tax=Musca autumnalis TaxID=221902 RepID=UPI003CF132FC
MSLLNSSSMMLPINLPILPLKCLQNNVFQKCLLPRNVLNEIGASPGDWAKCWFHLVENENLNFGLCQLFPRDGDADSVCYLDVTVCKFMPPRNDEQQQMLDHIELMQRNNEIPLEEVEISFSLSADGIMSLSSIPRTSLRDIALILLQPYHFCTSCMVISPELQRIGIDYISIQINSNNNSSRFVLTDNTKVIFGNISNISLTNYYECRNLTCFGGVSAFKKARKELDDLMETATIHRGSKSSHIMNLNILLVGAVGCGKTSLVEDFFFQNMCNVFRLKTSNLIKQYPGEAETELRNFFKNVKYFNDNFPSKGVNVILMEDVHLLCQQPKVKANNSETSTNAMRILTQFLSLLDELNRTKRGILCVGTTHNTEVLDESVKRPGRFDKEITISALSLEDRHTILEELFKESLPNNIFPTHVIDLVSKQTQGYVLADLALFSRNVTHAILTKPTESHEEIMTECLKKSKPASVRETDVTVCKTYERFSKIGGMDQLKKILEVTVLAGLKQEKSFRRFGLSLPKGVLLYGPPGCAKTTIAKCLATEANMTFIATSGAEVYSPYVGCAEKFIAKIFNTARKNAPCLIFLDEIDSLIGRRSVNGSSGDVQIRILSTILTEMDGIMGSNALDGVNANNHILVVAATNRPDMVDDALMRPGRFDKLIHVPAPDYNSRRAILALYKEKMPFATDVDIDQIAELTQNFSGADICNLCNEAAINAFQRDFNANEIKHEDFVHILKTSLKSSLTQSQIDWYYDFERRFHR